MQICKKNWRHSSPRNKKIESGVVMNIAKRKKRQRTSVHTRGE